MESFCDSLDNFSRTNTENVTSIETEFNSANEETSIENIISELTGGVVEQVNKSIPKYDVEAPETTGGVTLQQPPNVGEILITDESLITPTSHNVSVINAACQQVLKEMECQLLILLKKNRKEQEIIQNDLSTNCRNSALEINKKPFLKCAGMPYFKDTYGFQPPPNEDVLRKQKNNKLLPIDFLKSFSVWNSTDAKKLIHAVQQYPASKPLAIDWMKISVIDMDGKYSPSECKAKWIMHLNPSINRSRWSMKEIESLKELVAKYNYQNWDVIAAELGTNRTGLQCCIQYQTHTFPTEGKWTKEEDESLKTLVDRYKVKDYIPWKKVVWHFEDRSAKQCQERYAYHLVNIKKGAFSKEEDFIIVYMASKLKNFGEVAKFLPKRVSTQVRARYEYLVELSMPKFSKEEDELLTKLMAKYPRNWGKISENFKNRSRVQCRRRWAHLQKKIQLEISSESENEECVNSTPEKNTMKITKNEVDAENIKKVYHCISRASCGDRRYSEMYSRLLDYHKNCYKFLFGPKPRIPSNSEELKKLTSKMVVTMKNLSVTPMGPLNGFNITTVFNNCEFDKEDLEVLTDLSNKEPENPAPQFSRNIIPPNFMTLAALRTLTLGWNQIKNMCTSDENVHQPSSQIDPNDRILCSDAKKLFKARLKTILAFPLILSNIYPKEKQNPNYKPKVRKAVKPLSKRRRKEHARLMSAAYRNKLKKLEEKDLNNTQVEENNLFLETHESTEKILKPDSDLKSREESKSIEVNCDGLIRTEINRKRPQGMTTENESVIPLKRKVTRKKT